MARIIFLDVSSYGVSPKILGLNYEFFGSVFG